MATALPMWDLGRSHNDLPAHDDVEGQVEKLLQSCIELLLQDLRNAIVFRVKITAHVNGRYAKVTFVFNGSTLDGLSNELILGTLPFSAQNQKFTDEIASLIKAVSWNLPSAVTGAYLKVRFHGSYLPQSDIDVIVTKMNFPISHVKIFSADGTTSFLSRRLTSALARRITERQRVKVENSSQSRYLDVHERDSEVGGSVTRMAIYNSEISKARVIRIAMIVGFCIVLTSPVLSLVTVLTNSVYLAYFTPVLLLGGLLLMYFSQMKMNYKFRSGVC